MKKITQPKDFLFAIILLAIFSVATAGFIQSTKIKSKASLNYTSDIQHIKK
jgi:hypothetical protein